MPLPEADTASRKRGSSPGDRITASQAAWLTPRHSRRAHHAHAQAASGIEPWPPRRTRPGNSPHRSAARPAGNHLLSRRDTGRPGMAGGRQPLLIPQTGVSNGPQPPQAQQLMQLTEPLPTPRTFHGGCVLGQELRMVTPRAARRGFRLDHQDHDHRLDAQSLPTPFSAFRGLPLTVARTPSVCEQHSRRAPVLSSTGQGHDHQTEISALPADYTAQSAQGAGLNQDQGAPVPLGSPASRRATGASIAMRECSPGLRSHQRSQGLSCVRPDGGPAHRTRVREDWAQPRST
jgi:hypothetical protein